VPATVTISDDVGNALGNLPFAGETYEIDRTRFFYLPVVLNDN
jgi:hypothetical protein